MTANEDLDDAVSMLYETGVQMLTDVMKSEVLSRQKRLFLGCWARRLQEASHFAFGQKEAGLLGDADILGLVRLEMDIARDYREREPSPV